MTILPSDKLPDLRTASGTTMEVYGVKYVAYQLSQDTAMKVKYYVCDVHAPILSTGGMIRSGYSVILDAKPHIKLFGWHACALHSDD